MNRAVQNVWGEGEAFYCPLLTVDFKTEDQPHLEALLTAQVLLCPSTCAKLMEVSSSRGPQGFSGGGVGFQVDSLV